MSKLPQLKPKEVVSAIQRMGFYLDRQRGSHAFFKHPDGRFTVVPMYKGTLAKGTINSILKDLKTTSRESRKYL